MDDRLDASEARCFRFLCRRDAYLESRLFFRNVHGLLSFADGIFLTLL